MPITYHKTGEGARRLFRFQNDGAPGQGVGVRVPFALAVDTDGQGRFFREMPRPDDPVREGFMFGGWEIDGEMFNFDTPAVGDFTLTAVWAIPWDDHQSMINAVERGATGTLIKNAGVDDDGASPST